jgi:hypothetical protein
LLVSGNPDDHNVVVSMHLTILSIYAWPFLSAALGTYGLWSHIVVSDCISFRFRAGVNAIRHFNSSAKKKNPLLALPFKSLSSIFRCLLQLAAALAPLLILASETFKFLGQQEVEKVAR